MRLEQEDARKVWWVEKSIHSTGAALVGRLCCYRDRFYRIQGFRSATALSGELWVHVMVDGLAELNGCVSVSKEILRFQAPAMPADRSKIAPIVVFLSSRGLSFVGGLSVEARAFAASLDYLEQVEWASSALKRLTSLEAGVLSTLEKAKGNELLEPSIPRLEEALASFADQRLKLRQHISGSREASKKLYDYLSVPEVVRSIINFDLDSHADLGAFADLRDSFDEVVALNDAYRELLRDRIS